MRTFKRPKEDIECENTPALIMATNQQPIASNNSKKTFIVTQ